MGIWQWIVETLRAYPELAIFLALAVGFWLGPKKLAGFSLGNVTATLLAAVAIGQLGIADARAPSSRRSSCCSCSPSATASGRSSSAAWARKGRSRSCSR